MKTKIKYIENKSSRNGRGEAWIGAVEFSKTGQTVYFNNKAFKKLKRVGVAGNHFDIETGEEYWISGIKKNGQDRHWAGGGKIKIDRNIVTSYLSFVDFDEIDESNFELIDVEPTKKERFLELEHEVEDKRLNDFNTKKH